MKSSRLIRTLIVDDEPLARSNLRVLLQRDPSVEIVAETGSGVDAPSIIRRDKPDLLFLDVQMPEFDGFDVLELLGADLPPAIVFVTAFDHYALRAFEAGALDYLLKPFDDGRFELALSRAKQKIFLGKGSPRYLETLAIKSAGQIAFLPASEVDWIEAADYYAEIHVGSHTHLLRRTLTELDHDLDPALFCRVHRSAIVNLDRVRHVRFSEDGGYAVLLANEVMLPLGRKYRKQFQARLALRSGFAR